MRLAVRLTPKAAKDAVAGVEMLSDGQAVLKVRVRAVPEKGLANQALVKLLAKNLEIPKSDVVVRSGATSRVKMLQISGPADALGQRLRDLSGSF